MSGLLTFCLRGVRKQPGDSSPGFGLTPTREGESIMSESVLNRRQFLSRSAGAVALMPVTAAMARVPGANEKISIGVIGTGQRGRNALMPEVHRFSEQENVEIVAVCDPWNEAREKAVAKVKEWYGREPRQFIHFQDLLALKDVDAVKENRIYNFPCDLTCRASVNTGIFVSWLASRKNRQSRYYSCR